MTIEQEYDRVAGIFGVRHDVAISQMFGKACLKVGGKAFAACHNDRVVFKLVGTDHDDAPSIPGAHLWDAGGKGRPMKEWVALPIEASSRFDQFAEAAFSYVLR